MVAEVVGATSGEEAVEGRAHLVGIGGDGPLDVVLLPGQTGVDIDVALLVEEAVGGFYAVLGNHDVCWFTRYSLSICLVIMVLLDSA